jgi:hypothetical protein
MDCVTVSVWEFFCFSVILEVLVVFCYVFILSFF